MAFWCTKLDEFWHKRLFESFCVLKIRRIFMNLKFSLQPTKGNICYFQSELDSAVKAIKAKKNILIVGHERTGKTSFLNNISASLEKPFIPIIFSAGMCSDLDVYIRANICNILSAYPESFGSADDLFSLSIIEIDKKVSSLKLGDAVRQVLKMLLLYTHDPKISLDEVIRSFLLLPSMIAADTKMTAVVMIDDLDFVRQLKSDRGVSAGFIDIITKPVEHVVFVVSSSRSMRLDRFNEMLLPSLSLESSRRFFSDAKLELSESGLSTIFNITEGSLFYLNFFARALSRGGAKDPAGITALLDDSLDNELHIYFSERLKQLSPRELPILFCMAEHKVNTPSRISKLLNYSQTNVRRFLSIMEEKGFVALRERGTFEIHDPVFRRWLERNSKL